MSAAELLAAALALLVALLFPTDTSGKDRRVDFRGDVHVGDSRQGGNLKHGDDRVGKIRLLDLFIAPSEQRFRNRPGGDRKRVYRVKGRLSVIPDAGWEVGFASCAMGVGGKAFALSSPKGKRLFYPRDRSNLETASTEGTVKASLYGAEVTIPFPGFTYHVEQDSIAVESNARSSRRHKWEWDTGDPRPSSESFGFAGHWAAPAGKIEVFFLCKAFALDEGSIFQATQLARAKLKLRRELRP
jgi:hypothetical protein